MAILEALEHVKVNQPDLPVLSEMNTAHHMLAVAALDAYPEQTSDIENGFIDRTRSVVRAMLWQKLENDNLEDYLIHPAELTKEPSETNVVFMYQARARANYTHILVEAGLDPGAPKLDYDQVLLLGDALRRYVPPQAESLEHYDGAASTFAEKLGLFEGDVEYPDRQTREGELWMRTPSINDK